MRRDALQKQGSKTPHKQEQTGKKNRGFRSKEYQGCEEDEEEGGAKDALEAKVSAFPKRFFKSKSTSRLNLSFDVASEDAYVRTPPASLPLSKHSHFEASNAGIGGKSIVWHGRPVLRT